MLVYLVTGGLLLVYLVLVWFLGTWMHPPGAGIWILRGGLWLIGLIAAGSFLWFYRKSKAEESGDENASAKVSDDLDVLVHEAIRRLKASTLGRGASLGNLPLVFLLGESGSTKTTTIIHSALDPELLAGQVYQDNNIVATRVANVWYTRQAIFVDPAGGLLTESGRWKRLVKLVQPGRFSNAMGKGQQAARAAIVCYDCENFMKPGASETTLSAARKLAIRLQEVSQLLGISFPVYVLFTKLDRISFFPEFARGLSKEEASEVLGATLPVRLVATGVYAEEETRRLAKAFDELFYSLAERRLDLLARENEGDKKPGIYEFPRELRKLRTLLVQFLVDLARPSQLSVNPFLRGFYFSGVRPVVIDDVAAAVAAPEVQAEDPGSSAGATRIFSTAGRGGSPTASGCPRGWISKSAAMGFPQPVFQRRHRQGPRGVGCEWFQFPGESAKTRCFDFSGYCRHGLQHWIPRVLPWQSCFGKQCQQGGQRASTRASPPKPSTQLERFAETRPAAAATGDPFGLSKQRNSMESALGTLRRRSDLSRRPEYLLPGISKAFVRRCASPFIGRTPQRS